MDEIDRPPDPEEEHAIAMSNCLAFPVTHGILESIGTLMELGVELNINGFLQAVKRGDLAIFQVLVDNGWGVNTIKFGKRSL